MPSPEDKEPFILAAGRLWDEAKNVRLLAGIAGELDWPVRIAGASHFPGRSEIGTLSTTAERIGDLDRPQLLNTMRDAAIFAACPLYEPFGLTILEAAANGCALVLSDIPTLRELWDGAAIFANPRDPASFRDALQRVCKSTHLRNRLQAASKRRANLYGIAATADGYFALYQQLIGARKQRSAAAAVSHEARA
jgi:glycosyltransferase involved in cell wall biosynthesis